MTDAAIQSISLVVIAFFAMVGPIVLAYFQLKQTRETRANRVGIENLTDTVAIIKTQTDGLTSALVKKTEEKANADIDAALLAGKEEGRIAGELKEAAAAAGRAEVRKEIANGKLEAVVTEAVGGIADGPVEGEVAKGKLIVEEKK